MRQTVEKNRSVEDDEEKNKLNHYSKHNIMLYLVANMVYHLHTLYIYRKMSFMKNFSSPFVHITIQYDKVPPLYNKQQ